MPDTPGKPMSANPGSPGAAKVALIACSVFDRELKLVAGNASHIVAQVRLEMGLHDTPELLRKRLQDEIDALEAGPLDFEVIVLAYGLCGRGADGLRAGRHPLVIARGHDCFTHLLGSAALHASRQARYPDSYYYSPGWNEARRVPGPERLEKLRKELSERFDPEDVDFLLQTEQELWKSRSLGVFVDLGTPEAETEAKYAQGCCEWLGWSFERVQGDPTLMRDLLWGPWDTQRFQVVPPGGVLRFSRDERTFCVSET